MGNYSMAGGDYQLFMAQPLDKHLKSFDGAGVVSRLAVVLIALQMVIWGLPLHGLAGSCEREAVNCCCDAAAGAHEEMPSDGSCCSNCLSCLSHQQEDETTDWPQPAPLEGAMARHLPAPSVVDLSPVRPDISGSGIRPAHAKATRLPLRPRSVLSIWRL
ncbi:MAG: hypothetical protein ACP5I4_02875 [Oceanipulchritudo sp.]